MNRKATHTLVNKNHVTGAEGMLDLCLTHHSPVGQPVPACGELVSLVLATVSKHLCETGTHTREGRNPCLLRRGGCQPLEIRSEKREYVLRRLLAIRYPGNKDIIINF